MPDGAGVRRAGRLKRWWLRSYVPLSVLVLGALSLGMLVWTNHLSKRQLLQSDFADTLQDLRIRVSTAHLWLEEAITFSAEEIDMAWADLAQARSLANALVEGGDTEHGSKIPPLQDARVRQLAVEIRQLLDEFVANTQERWRTLAKVGSPLDKRTNEIFESIQSRGSELELTLKELEAIRKALRAFLPDSVSKLAPVAEACRQGKDFGGMLREVYPALEKISIDYAVMEKSPKVLVVELKCEWLDVGSWPSLEEVSNLDESGNVVVAPNAVVLDSSRNIIVAEDDHLLAVLGMDECIVVHSSDATLVCNKSDSQRLKELVAAVEQKYGKKFL